MLNIPTTAKVVLNTKRGALTIELWAKETPETSRRFLEKCIDKTLIEYEFKNGEEKVVAESLGSNDGKTEPTLPLEAHSRLKFGERGMLYADQGSKRQDNSLSRWFVTTDERPELNQRVTLFGRVVSDPMYVLRQLGEAGPAKIESVDIVEPYFDDLPEPPVEESKEEVGEPKKRTVKVVYDEEEEPVLELKKPKKQTKAEDKEESQGDDKPAKASEEKPGKDETTNEETKGDKLEASNEDDDKETSRLTDEQTSPVTDQKDTPDQPQQSTEKPEKPRPLRRVDSFDENIDLAKWENVTDLSSHRLRLR